MPISALASTAMYSQVGINNTDPKATMDIAAKATDGSNQGLIALTYRRSGRRNTQYNQHNRHHYYLTTVRFSLARKIAKIIQRQNA